MNADPLSVQGFFNPGETDPDNTSALNKAESAIEWQLRQLATLDEQRIPQKQFARTLEERYTATLAAINTLLPALGHLTLPLPHKSRNLIRSLHELLQKLASLFSRPPYVLDAHLIKELREEEAIALCREMVLLKLHLQISFLAAAPSDVGIWLQLHQAYEKVRRLALESVHFDRVGEKPREIYFSAILTGCAQPASFCAREIEFVSACARRLAGQISLVAGDTPRTPGTFWIDPSHDAPATACSRKTSPPETPVLFFSCDGIAAQIKEELAALKKGARAETLNLPVFANTPAGQAVLQRLITSWGNPGKRRFPRRRQNYRSTLCSGLGNLWHLFQENEAGPLEISHWMVTNESPDGYSLMHLSGKTGHLSIGDITAIRTETGDQWQTCIVRWALSENREHLELGLQILSTQTIPAFLVFPAEKEESRRLPVLILPEIPALRTNELLVTPPGALSENPGKFFLVVEKGNIEIREINRAQIDEQNSQVALFSIRPDDLPD